MVGGRFRDPFFFNFGKIFSELRLGLMQSANQRAPVHSSTPSTEPGELIWISFRKYLRVFSNKLPNFAAIAATDVQNGDGHDAAAMRVVTKMSVLAQQVRE